MRGNKVTMPWCAVLPGVLAACSAFAEPGAEPAGADAIIRAERQRAERVLETAKSILDAAGRESVAGALDRELREKAERMHEFALPRSAPAERDPFAVTPQLRAGGGRSPTPGYIRAIPGMPIGEAPLMALKGIAGSAGRRLALIDIKGSGILRLRQGENFQVDDQAYFVREIRGDAVLLETGFAEKTLIMVR